MALTPVVLNPGVGGAQIQTDQIGGNAYEVIKSAFGSEGTATMVDAAHPLPVTDAISEAALVSIAAEDFATETTLAALLAKVIAAPSTEAKQNAMITLLTTISAIVQPLTDTQLRATPVPVSGTVTVDTSLLATQATLAAILAKIIAAPATAANQATEIASLANLDVALSTRLKAADTLAAVTTVGTITNNVNTVEVAPTTIFNGVKTVTTAGTRVTLAASTTVKSVTIKALAANTGIIYVGNSTVSSVNGFQLAAGDTISLDIANLSTINIDSSVSSEGVSYISIN